MISYDTAPPHLAGKKPVIALPHALSKDKANLLQFNRLCCNVCLHCSKMVHKFYPFFIRHSSQTILKRGKEFEDNVSKAGLAVAKK